MKSGHFFFFLISTEFMSLCLRFDLLSREKSEFSPSANQRKVTFFLIYFLWRFHEQFFGKFCSIRWPDRSVTASRFFTSNRSSCAARLSTCSSKFDLIFKSFFLKQQIKTIKPTVIKLIDTSHFGLI